MNKKRTMSLLAAIVAMGGFALAVWIPAASAQKSDASGVYTQYCEYTQYSEYGEYCEPQTTTTVINGTTTAITSPGFTITSGNPPVAPPTSPGAPAGVIISSNGQAVIDLAKLTIGKAVIANGVSVTLEKVYANGNVAVTFGGVEAVFPATAAISIAKDGVVSVAFAVVGPTGKRAALTTTARSVVATQEVILPKGRLASTFAYTLTKGVSFGAKTTWAQIPKYFAVQTVGGKKVAKLSLKASANKARSAVTLKLNKAERSFAIRFAVSKLSYTKAEETYVAKHKIKSLAPTFKVISTTSKAKSTKADPFAFSYPL